MHEFQSNLRSTDEAITGKVFGILSKECQTDWNAYIYHPFVQQMADGTLPAECFRHYLIQLYLFSKHYCRAYALAVFKSDHLDDLKEAAAHLDLHLNYEMELHVAYCAQWDISRDQLDSWPEDDACRLYTRYVLDQGLAGDLLDLLVALIPCSVGYAEIGRRLLNDSATKTTGNPYSDWIDLHGGPEFQDAGRDMQLYVDRVALRRGVTCDDISTQRWQSLIRNFKTATQLEFRFWQMGLAPPL